jgi:L-fuconolactonase
MFKSFFDRLQYSPSGDGGMNGSIIDAHQHFWKFDPVRDSWITDEMKVIQRDFMPNDLEPILKANSVTGTVIVQSDQSEAENEFQLKNAENNFIKGVVGWVDVQSENVEERLEYYHQFNKMKGFRHVLQGEADRALMLKPNFKRGIRLLNKYNYTYDILIYPDQLKYIPSFVAMFPHQKFVIDHIAKPYIKDKKIDEWKDEIKAVAQYENVFCKVSGMVTEADCKAWKHEDFLPYLDVVVEAFGMDRIMYGSDWPVCLCAASYAEVLNITKQYFSSVSVDEQNKFYSKNAISFYHL